MFPLFENFPFIKKDGSRTTLGNAISQGGGSYTLPTASPTTKGGVKVGSGLTMDGETLNNSNPTPYSLPVAAANVLGGIMIGAGLTIDENGVLSINGGGGGSSLHLFKVTTSNTKISEVYILTTAENITNAASIKTALATGIGVITSGYNLNNVSVFATDYNQSGRIAIHEISASTTSGETVTTALSHSSSVQETTYISGVSATKLF